MADDSVLVQIANLERRRQQLETDLSYYRAATLRATSQLEAIEAKIASLARAPS